MVDHMIRLSRDDEDGSISINVQLSPYLPIWRRALVALRYVFGDNWRCHWSDTVVAKEDRQRLVEFIAHKEN